MSLESQLFQGHSTKHQVQDTFLECKSCNSLFEISGSSCSECDSHISASDTRTAKVDAADCDICGETTLYTRDNRVDTNYNIFGYICGNCENILEMKFNGSFCQPNSFLQNDLGSGFRMTPIDSEKKTTTVWMFSLQTKVEDVGFWSYQPDEYTVWLASVDETYCGYVSLNNDNVLNQIWVDQGYRRSDVATQMVKYICKDVLSEQDELVISQTTDKGREFFKSLQQDGDVFNKTLMVSY